MSQKKVLVTGGFGYVGSRLTPYLLEKGHNVRVLDLNLYGDDGLDALKKHPKWGEFQSRFEFVRGDIRHGDTVQKAVQGIDSIIHLAAISNDPTGEVDETLTRQVNFDAIGQMLALAKSGGVKRFISASSSSVFGARTESDINESLEPEPLTYYSKYKMLSEWLVVAANNPDFVTVSIRPATICGYSPRQRFDLTVNKLTADAITKRVITVHGGEQRRPNLGITDMIRCYEELLNTPAAKIAGRTFNCGFENLKVMEIAQLIQKQLADLDVRIDRTETKDNRDYHISSKKITAELGFSPKGTIATEVQDLRKALESGAFPNTDAEKHYNMKSMQMKRDPSSYAFLSK